MGNDYIMIAKPIDPTLCGLGSALVNSFIVERDDAFIEIIDLLDEITPEAGCKGQKESV